MSIPWVTVQDAIVEWVANATGLAPARVWWADQGIPRPESSGGAWISLNPITVASPGHDWVTSEANPTPTPGRERIRRVQGTRTVQLSIQCFNGTAVDATNPKALLDDVVLAISLPDQASAFVAAGFGIGDIGPVQTASGVINSTRFEPRATLTVVLHTTAELVGYGTTIDSVEVSIVTPVGNDDDPVDHVSAFVVPHDAD